MNNTCVIVTGAIRSGTSLTAKILQELGIWMGYNLTEPTPKNIKGGYIEDGFFNGVNLQITGTRTWDKILDVALEVKNDNKVFELGNFDNKYIRQIEHRCLSRNSWGVKDVRFCFPHLLDVFIEIVHECGFETKVICATRHPSQIAQSIAYSREVEVTDKIIQATQAMHDLSLLVCENVYTEVLFADFDSAFAEPKEYCQRLADFIGVDYIVGVEQNIISSLRHIHGSLDEEL